MTDEMEEQRGFFFLPRCLANTCITRCGFQQWPHLFALCHFCSYFKELFGISTELHFPSLLSKDILTWKCCVNVYFLAMVKICSRFEIQLFEAKNRVFEFDYQTINTFEYVPCSKNYGQVCLMFGKVMFWQKCTFS